MQYLTNWGVVRYMFHFLHYIYIQEFKWKQVLEHWRNIITINLYCCHHLKWCMQQKRWSQPVNGRAKAERSGLRVDSSTYREHNFPLCSLFCKKQWVKVVYWLRSGIKKQHSAQVWTLFPRSQNLVSKVTDNQNTQETKNSFFLRMCLSFST